MKNSLLLIFLTFLLSCESNKDATPALPYSSGVVVVNSGNFSDNNGSLSFISSAGATEPDLFLKVNNKSFTGGLSAYTEVGSKAVILVDNSTAGKDGIEIVEAGTHKSIASISGTEIENPRNVIKVSDNKAYITAWDATGDFTNFFKNSGYVAVLDLVTNKITKKIPVQNAAETIYLVGRTAYIGNSGTGKTKLTLINTDTDVISGTVEVGADPTIIGLDANNKLWVYTAGSFKTVNTSTNMVESTHKITVSNLEKTPSNFSFSADKKTIFLSYSFYDAADSYKQKGETYSFSTVATPATLLIVKPYLSKLFNGIGVDPKTGNLYGAFVPSYKQAGLVYKYSPQGILLDSTKVGIGPSKFIFK